MNTTRPRRWVGPSLALQIMGLLVGGLVVAQLVTLALTWLLPPEPQPTYGLEDIARVLAVAEPDTARKLQRVIRDGPPEPTGPGWLTSARSRHDLARLLDRDEADVRLFFYTPLPFAGATGVVPREPPAVPGRRPVAFDGDAAQVRIAYADWQVAQAGPGGGPRGPGGRAGPDGGMPGGPRVEAPSTRDGFPNAGRPTERPATRGTPVDASSERARAGEMPGVSRSASQPEPATTVDPTSESPIVATPPAATRDALEAPRAATPVAPMTGPAPSRKNDASTSKRTTIPSARVDERPVAVAPTRGLFGFAPAPFVEGDFVAALRLVSGGWAVVQPTPEPFPNAWQRRVLLWFVIAAVLVAPLAWLFSRRLVRPIAGFAEAAERLGRDPTAAILPLDGPAEVGRAAHAFNRMQNRLRSFVDDRTAMIGAISHDLRTRPRACAFASRTRPTPCATGCCTTSTRWRR